MANQLYGKFNLAENYFANIISVKFNLKRFTSKYLCSVIALIYDIIYYFSTRFNF